MFFLMKLAKQALKHHRFMIQQKMLNTEQCAVLIHFSGVKGNLKKMFFDREQVLRMRF